MLFATLAFFVVSLGYGVVVPLLHRLLGVPKAELSSHVAWILGAYSAAKISCQFPAGLLVDRFGARPVVRLAMVIFSLSMTGFLLPGPSWWFVLLRGVEGAATGFLFPALMALVMAAGESDQAGSRLGEAIGIGTAGMLVGPALGVMAKYTSPLVPLAVSAGLAWAVTLASLRPAPKGEAPARGASLGLGSIRQHWAKGALAIVSLPISYNKLVFSATQGLLPLVALRVLGWGQPGITLLFAITGIAFGVFQGLGGPLADKIGARKLVLLCAPPLVGTLGLLSQMKGGVGFAVVYGGYVACASLIFAGTMTHIGQRFGAKDRFGGTFGAVGSMTDIATLLGPLLFVKPYDRAGGWIFLIMAGASVVFYLPFGLLANQQAHTPETAMEELPGPAAPYP